MGTYSLTETKRREGAAPAAGRVNYLGMFPLFVLGFLGLALARTLGFIPDVTIHLTDAALPGAGDYPLSLRQLATQGSHLCVVLSMAAVGLETRFSAMKQTGARPFLAALLGALAIALLVLAAVLVLKM